MTDTDRRIETSKKRLMLLLELIQEIELIAKRGLNR